MAELADGVRRSYLAGLDGMSDDELEQECRRLTAQLRGVLGGSFTAPERDRGMLRLVMAEQERRAGDQHTPSTYDLEQAYFATRRHLTRQEARAEFQRWLTGLSERIAAEARAADRQQIIDLIRELKD